MAIHVICSCGKQLNAREDSAGKRIRCPFCDRVLQVPVPVMETSDFEVQPLPAGNNVRINADVVDVPIPIPIPIIPNPVEAVDVSNLTESAAKTRRQYKVLSRQDPWFAGNFHPDDLEEALNSYALQGWHLHSIFPVRPPNAETEEVVVVLER